MVRHSAFVLSLAVVVLVGLPASLIVGVWGNCTAASLEPMTIDGPPSVYVYRDFQTVVSTLYATEANHPDIAKVYDIGDSWEKTAGIADRDILAVKISDNPGVEEDEPEVLIIARLHAGEYPSTEIALQLIENMTDLYGIDARTSWLVDNRETWIIPVANPDGMEYAMTVDDTWRKNRRDNGDGTFGVDLNRNFDGSQNGDPLGEWGGAGTSTDTSSVVYCGEYAFSEPETQAIRDLVLSHDFQLAIDFHWCALWVMWPWGYTTNLPSDNDDLVRIGTELAEVTDYYASQSSEMYPTTGDSLDWLYGGADVYPFCIEVGRWNDWSQHELRALLNDIYINIRGSMLLAEIADDREEAQFDIEHDPLDDSMYSDVGFQVVADMTAARGVDTSALYVRYRADDGAWSEVPMAATDRVDEYSGLIPSQAGGCNIDYYIVAHDLSGVERTSPRYAPYEVHSFDVIPDTEPPSANAGHEITTFIGVETMLDGSASDDNVGVVSYVWSFLYEGDLVELYGVCPTFTFWITGVYEVTLTVKDGSGNVDTDTVSVTVIDARG